MLSQAWLCFGSLTWTWETSIFWIGRYTYGFAILSLDCQKVTSWWGGSILPTSQHVKRLSKHRLELVARNRRTELVSWTVQTNRYHPPTLKMFTCIHSVKCFLSWALHDWASLQHVSEIRQGSWPQLWDVINCFEISFYLNSTHTYHKPSS